MADDREHLELSGEEPDDAAEREAPDALPDKAEDAVEVHEADNPFAAEMGGKFGEEEPAEDAPWTVPTGKLAHNKARRVVGHPVSLCIGLCGYCVFGLWTVLFMGFHCGLCTIEWIPACVQAVVAFPIGLWVVLCAALGYLALIPGCGAKFRGHFLWLPAAIFADIVYFAFLVIHYIQESLYYDGPWYLKVASDLIWTVYVVVGFLLGLYVAFALFLRADRRAAKTRRRRRSRASKTGFERVEDVGGPADVPVEPVDGVETGLETDEPVQQ